MISLKALIVEDWDSDEQRDAWRKDWLERHRATFDEKGRLIAYHGTTPKNARLIKKTGFRTHSYFSLNPEFSRGITSTYHDIPEGKVIVFTVHLPLDAVDFSASYIIAMREIGFEEVI